MLPPVNHRLLFSDWLESPGYIKVRDSEEASLADDMGVPRHLQVPLSIDTSISYDLDNSMFPSLDDPRYKHEPVLLIASQPGHGYGEITKRPHRTDCQIRKKEVATDSSYSYTSEQLLLDDLIEFMDISTQDLLVGLRNTETYLSLVEDVISEIPTSDELQYLHGPAFTDHKRYKTTCYRGRQAVNNFTFKQSSVSSGQQISYSDSVGHQRMCSQERQSVNSSVPNHQIPYPMSSTVGYADLSISEHQRGFRGNGSRSSCVSKGYCVSTGHVLPHTDRHQSSVVTQGYTKRKRVADSFSSIQKRPCFDNEQMEYFRQYQSRQRNYSNRFSGVPSAHQIRVI